MSRGYEQNEKGEWVIFDDDFTERQQHQREANRAAAGTMGADERPKFETPYNTARRIVCEEWHQAVKEYGLTPGSVTEKVIGRIITRLDETAWPGTAPRS